MLLALASLFAAHAHTHNNIRGGQYERTTETSTGRSNGGRGARGERHTATRNSLSLTHTHARTTHSSVAGALKKQLRSNRQGCRPPDNTYLQARADTTRAEHEANTMDSHFGCLCCAACHEFCEPWTECKLLGRRTGSCSWSICSSRFVDLGDGCAGRLPIQ